MASDEVVSSFFTLQGHQRRRLTEAKEVVFWQCFSLIISDPSSVIISATLLN